MTEPPAIEMTTRSLPGRGLEYVKPHDLGLEALCDCGTVTVLTIDSEDVRRFNEAGETREIAVTCGPEGGCGSVHWLTFTPREVPGG